MVLLSELKKRSIFFYYQEASLKQLCSVLRCTVASLLIAKDKPPPITLSRSGCIVATSLYVFILMVCVSWYAMGLCESKREEEPLGKYFVQSVLPMVWLFCEAFQIDTLYKKGTTNTQVPDLFHVTELRSLCPSPHLSGFFLFT